TYVDADGQRKRPYMVHRALLGSIERFFGVYLEHTAGAFPIWLAPEQAVVVPVAPAFDEYARKTAADLAASGLRARADLSDDRMNAKIRNAQNQKIPYILVVGAKEAEEGAVAVRVRDGTQLGVLKVADFAARALGKIQAKALDL
ncbi:MAG: threonine--tRNA ligase, partial [Treponema sp.]|nr:threonine--tRNA ligase [Treponema sp.]